jgi:putative oxidoreductase
MDTENLPTLDELNFGLLALRLVVGPVFAFHGFAKITRGGKLDGTARWFDSLGMRPGHLHARFAAAGELATGTCIALVFNNGWEYNLVLGAIGVTLATIGAGEWSLDNAIGIDLNGPVGFVISLAGGLAIAAGLLATFYRPPAPADTAADAI